MTRRERLERKLEKREEWAEKAEKRSEVALDGARRLADSIPLGQPILVGHHSEGRARRDADHIHNGMVRGFEQSNLAKHHISKAAGLAQQLDRAIFTDDADAISALEARIAGREEEAAKYKAINAAWRKAKGDSEEKAASFAASGLVSPVLARTIMDTMRVCPWLRVPFDLTNIRANIRRDRERIEEVKRRAETAAKAEAAPAGVAIEGGDWVCVTFAEKPDREILISLKAAGFRWSGGSWCGYREKIPAVVAELAS